MKLKEKIAVSSPSRFDVARQQLRDEMDLALQQLEGKYSIQNPDYWKALKSVQSEFTDKLREVDEAERFHQQSLAQKEQDNPLLTPEQKYVNEARRMKRIKLDSLINKLISCSSSGNVADVDPQDPFYLDKTDPLGVFERWWESAMSDLPSLDELHKFLDKIDINDRGFITFDAQADDLSKANQPFNVVKLKTGIMRSAAEARKQQKQLEIDRLKRRSPLLAKKDPEAYLKKQNKLKSAAKAAGKVSALDNILASYGLPLELEDLLQKHLEDVFIFRSKGRPEEYKEMLELFLRNVTDPQQRIYAVRKCIQNNWGNLQYGAN